MTNKDIQRIDNWIERCNDLPRDASWKIKILKGEDTGEDKVSSQKLIDEIDNIFMELNAFIKVKFGSEHEYLRKSLLISFDPKFAKQLILARDYNLFHSAWRQGVDKTIFLLKNIKAEVELRIEDNKDKDDTTKIGGSNENNIHNSQVIFGDVKDSSISRGHNIEQNDNPKGPTRKLQIVAIIVSILIFIITMIVKFIL